MSSLALRYDRKSSIPTYSSPPNGLLTKTTKQTYVDFTKSKDLVADVKAATPGGLGAHAVILLAVSEKPFQQASEYVRSRGTIVAIGLPPDAFLKAPVINTVVRMITIKGSYVGNQQDGVEALDFFARGLIKAPFKLAPLKDLPKIFELMGMSHSLTYIYTRLKLT